MKLIIDKEIFSKFAPLKIAALVFENVDNKANVDDFFAAEYAAVAEEVCLDYTAALQAVAVEEEPNPAKLKWDC